MKTLGFYYHETKNNTLKKLIYINRKNKDILDKAEKIRPNNISLSEFIFMALDFFTETHTVNKNNLTSLDEPKILDNIEIWKKWLEMSDVIKLSTYEERTKQLQGIIEDRFEGIKNA